MRKIKKSQYYSKQYTPTALWADEIGDLVEAVQGVCNTVTFVADDFHYGSVDEFVRESKGRQPLNVCLSGGCRS